MNKILPTNGYLLRNVVIMVKENLTIMEQTIQTTLKRWESSIINYGKVDQWNINEDYSILRIFISSSKSNTARKAVTECLDYSILNDYDVAVLLSKIQNANRILNKQNDSRINKEMNKLNSVCQSKRFFSTTKKLYNERLKFKNGEYLKVVDITIEDGATSRKVRRIVEKRMCQAYHRQKKNTHSEGGQDRHYMKRATSFQLHNLGQIERSKGFIRSHSTHWKKVYDPITRKIVLKKKMEYSSIKEANQAAKEYMHRSPYDTRRINAYICEYCGKWHIGHSAPEEVKMHPVKVTLYELAS